MRAADGLSEPSGAAYPRLRLAEYTKSARPAGLVTLRRRPVEGRLGRLGPSACQTRRHMARFSVVVPFDPVVQEALDSRVFTNIPDADLAAGIRIRRDGDGYTAQLEIQADRPGVAKAMAVDLVERFLSVIATWNHGFQIRIGGVRSEVIDSGGSATVTVAGPGLVAVSASDTLFMEGHLQVVVGKANLDAEDAFLQRYDELPEYLRSCLELNYLLVLSTRPPNRWLLAATGLEAWRSVRSAPRRPSRPN